TEARGHAAGERDRTVGPAFGLSRASHPRLPPARAVLVAERKTRQRTSAGTFEIAMNGVDGFDFAGSQAIGTVRPSAFQRLRMEIALAWIGNQSVGQPVLLVARGEHRLCQQRHFRRRKKMIRRRQKLLIDERTANLAE